MQTTVDAGESAFKPVIDFAALPIDDRRSFRGGRLIAIWAAGLLGIATLGLFGRFFEPTSADCCPEPAAAAAPALGVPAQDRLFMPPSPRVSTAIGISIARELDHHGALVQIHVAGQIDGPVGNIDVRLVDVGGGSSLGIATRHFAPIDGRPPSPLGAFDVWFDVPPDQTTASLWVTARAFVNGRIVNVLTLPIETGRPLEGPNRFVIDDLIPGAGSPTWSPDGAPHYDSSHTARVLGLGWQVDPYAK